MNESLILADECLIFADECLILVNESLNSVNESLILVNESLNSVNESFNSTPLPPFPAPHSPLLAQRAERGKFRHGFPRRWFRYMG
ncbi:MAG: hypothetical protein V7K21_09170 [Nostoc sp.]|uniref:hypothetical protein n=1 Tax=Nostoc sp. TaxID=1180 RepID=UPI002FF7C71C